MDVDFSSALCWLMCGKGNNFYARTMSALQTRESRPNEMIPMMGIVLQGRLLVLVYNVDWMDKAEFDDVVATLEHEALHVVLEHMPRKLTLAATFQTPEDRESFRRVTAWCEDFAANCLLIRSNDYMQAHLEEWLMPEQEPFCLPRDLTYEQYVQLVMERDQVSQQSQQAKEKGEDDGGDGGGFHQFLKDHGPGGMTIPIKLLSHAEWEKMTEGMSDEEKQGLATEMKQKIQDMVKKAVEEHQKSRGTVPAFLEEYIKKLLAPPKVPWIRVLREMVISTKRWKWKRSICRPNRRKIALAVLQPDKFVAFPGRGRDRSFTVVFCIDTSGSMGSRELEVALNELEYLRKADKDIEITVIEADAAIGREYLIDERTPVEWNLTGRGGTDFNDALSRARELNPDMCLYYTDGGATAPLVENRVACPFVWLITPNMSTPDADWGRVIEMHDQ